MTVLIFDFGLIKECLFGCGRQFRGSDRRIELVIPGPDRARTGITPGRKDSFVETGAPSHVQSGRIGEDEGSGRRGADGPIRLRRLALYFRRGRDAAVGQPLGPEMAILFSAAAMLNIMKRAGLRSDIVEIEE